MGLIEITKLVFEVIQCPFLHVVVTSMSYLSFVCSPLPEDHPPRPEALQPPPHPGRPRQDRRPRRLKRVRRQGRLLHQHGGDAGVYATGESGAQTGGRSLLGKGERSFFGSGQFTFGSFSKKRNFRNVKMKTFWIQLLVFSLSSNSAEIVHP